MAIIIYIAIFIILLLFKGWWDHRAKKKGRIINHGRSAIIDGALYVVAAYFLFCAPVWCGVWFMVGIVWTSFAFRWLLYDLLYNKINGEKWNHYGGSALLDKFMIWTGSYHLIVKLIILGIGINLIVWT